MARRGPLFAVPLLFFLCQRGQSADVGTCAADGPCRNDETPVSLLQTHANVAARNGLEQASQDSLSASLGKLAGISEKIKIAPPKTAFKENVVLTVVIYGLAAALAAVVQAVLALYNAIVYHIFCIAATVVFADSVHIGLAQSTIYMFCYYPLMDFMQIYHFRNAKRNWPFLLSYGIPLFIGLFGGLAVLHYANSPQMVWGLKVFMLFSCCMAIANETYMRIQKWRADAAAKEQADLAARLEHEEDLSTTAGETDAEEYEQRHQYARTTFEPGNLGITFMKDGTEVQRVSAEGQAHGKGVKVGWHVIAVNGLPYTKELLQSRVHGKRSFELTFDKAGESSTEPDVFESSIIDETQVTHMSSPSRIASPRKDLTIQADDIPETVDMSKPFNRIVAISCGGFAGFSLGANGIGGTFVLLMLNTLQISVPEWRCTQCVAEMPLHVVRAILVLSSGVVNINWAEDWKYVASVCIGTIVGLIGGNHFAAQIPAALLRQVVLGGIIITTVMLFGTVFNKEHGLWPWQ